MYAIISDSGRQFKVQEGQRVDVDYRELPAGESLTFSKVVAVSTEGGLKVGAPCVNGASVQAKVVGPKLGDKIVIQKFRRRKGYHRRKGHRQIYTTVMIEKITPG